LATTDKAPLTDEERRLILAIQDGLSLTPQPFAAVAEALGTTEARVLEMLDSLLDRGVVKRLGAVPNHYAVGITANGMAVWDVPDGRVSEAGRLLADQPEVSHCYRRPRRPPDWPYNLYAMVHGQSREEVLAVVKRLNSRSGLEHLPQEVLFSVRQFRKRGTRLAGEA
jgi:DNA-binding Lrp family transcriptional regulator